MVVCIMNKIAHSWSAVDVIQIAMASLLASVTMFCHHSNARYKNMIFLTASDEVSGSLNLFWLTLIVNLT